MKLIAVEEHFMFPELIAAGARFLASPAAAGSGWAEAAASLEDVEREQVAGRTLDLGERRIEAMDAAGIDVQLLLLSTVCNLQALEPAEGTQLARLANDRLAEAIAVHPDRFAGLASVAPQDPAAAADELGRAVGELGLRGAVINSHVAGAYLDQQRFWPILEAADALDVPIYLHPNLLPEDAIRPYLDYGLTAALWGYAAEASVHALRIILSGAFDRFPRLTVVLGHLGEHIPFTLPRIDTHHLNTKLKTTPGLQRLPSEYFKERFLVTTSGLNHAPESIRFCVEVLGAERVMFAADYPFEQPVLEAERFNAVALEQDVRELVAHANAERVFAL
jgi:2,3-dihydroxybenzoate decarboxylase